MNLNGALHQRQVLMLTEDLLWQSKAFISKLERRYSPLLFDLEELEYRYDKTLARYNEQKAYLKTWLNKLQAVN